MGYDRQAWVEGGSGIWGEGAEGGKFSDTMLVGTRGHAFHLSQWFSPGKSLGWRKSSTVVVSQLYPGSPNDEDRDAQGWAPRASLSWSLVPELEIIAISTDILCMLLCLCTCPINV